MRLCADNSPLVPLGTQAAAELEADQYALLWQGDAGNAHEINTRRDRRCETNTETKTTQSKTKTRERQDKDERQRLNKNDESKRRQDETKTKRRPVLK